MPYSRGCEHLLDRLVEEQAIFWSCRGRQRGAKSPDQGHDELLDDGIDLTGLYDVVVWLLSCDFSLDSRSCSILVVGGVSAARLELAHGLLLLGDLLFLVCLSIPFYVCFPGCLVQQQRLEKI